MKLIPGVGWLPCDPPAPENKARKEEENKSACSLCGSSALLEIDPEGDPRCYSKCDKCSLIFTQEQFLPSQEAETARYLDHNNSIENKGYVKLLNRVIQPALDFLTSEMKGLDYGCGYIPVLSQLLQREQIECHNYDPLFGYNPSLKEYDFIFSTECFEHFHHPAREIDNILSLLKSGGYLCVMTERWETIKRFHTWYYKRDLTHVSFFHQLTFDYLKQQYRLSEVYRDRNRVVILKK